MSLMFFLWICPFIRNVLHSFQPIVFEPYPKFYGSGAVYLGGIQERPYKVYTYLVGGGRVPLTLGVDFAAPLLVHVSRVEAR